MQYGLDILIPQKYNHTQPAEPYQYCWQNTYNAKSPPLCLQLEHSNAEEHYVSLGSVMTQMGKTYEHQIIREWDAISDVYLHITAGPLPAGCIWRRWWPLRLLTSSVLKINNHPIVSSDEGWSEMRQFMLADPRYTNTFDIAHPVERQESSQYSFEAIIPIEFLQMLKLVALGFLSASVQLNVTLANVQTLIECPAGQVVPEPPISVQLRAKASYFMISVRNELIMTLTDLCQSYATTTYQLQLDATHRATLNMSATGHCEAVYLWVTDSANQELPSSVICGITCMFNNGIRERISGLEARQVMPRRLPHSTNVPVCRPNAYFLSFVTKHHQEGIRLRSLDNATLLLDFVKDTPTNICVRIALAMRYGFNYETGETFEYNDPFIPKALLNPDKFNGLTGQIIIKK